MQATNGDIDIQINRHDRFQHEIEKCTRTKFVRTSLNTKSNRLASIKINTTRPQSCSATKFDHKSCPTPTLTNSTTFNQTFLSNQEINLFDARVHTRAVAREGVGHVWGQREVHRAQGEDQNMGGHTVVAQMCGGKSKGHRTPGCGRACAMW